MACDSDPDGCHITDTYDGFLDQLKTTVGKAGDKFGWDSHFTGSSKLVPWDSPDRYKNEKACYTLAMDWPPEATAFYRPCAPYKVKLTESIVLGHTHKNETPYPPMAGKPVLASHDVWATKYKSLEDSSVEEAAKRLAEAINSGQNPCGQSGVISNPQNESPIGPDHFATPTARPTNNKNPFKGKVTVDLDWD